MIMSLWQDDASEQARLIRKGSESEASTLRKD